MIEANKTKRMGLAAGIAVVVMGLVIWVSTSGAPDFTDYEAGAERKGAFFSYFLPIVQQHNQEIQATRDELEVWAQAPGDLGWWDRGDVEDLAEYYGMDAFDVSSKADWKTLLRRVDVVPPSLALAQAANESAWGTSRFATKGNNYYGQWCFTEGCGLVPNSRDAGKAHEVAEFDSPEESVERYIHNLNSHKAYAPLRSIRETLRDSGNTATGSALAAGLGKYSERGDEYIKELRQMMQFNKLGQYDQ
ncbi:glucosaminidase domain-containing protein [Marinobacter caseinilyticus]|uniref:glucosaminidase domain-containing protein n=1 Tax=Marinobacter caseinilyticus TaxID=2692195 RepID=UPI001A93F1FD|nr:glucosaminidase domain-containing protein [Marinobacter caseinilyticus]